MDENIVVLTGRLEHAVEVQEDYEYFYLITSSGTFEVRLNIDSKLYASLNKNVKLIVTGTLKNEEFYVNKDKKYNVFIKALGISFIGENKND